MQYNYGIKQGTSLPLQDVTRCSTGSSYVQWHRSLEWQKLTFEEEGCRLAPQRHGTWGWGMWREDERRVPVRIRLASDSQQLCGWDVSQTWTRWASDTSKRRSLQPATVVNMSCVKTTQILEVNKCPKVQKTWYDRFACPLHLSACLCFVQMLQSSKQLNVNDTKIADLVYHRLWRCGQQP